MTFGFKDTEDMLAATMEDQPLSVAARHPEFVPVTFAVHREEAEHVLALLERHHVPGMIDSDSNGELLRGLERGVPVLVPEQMHELATEIIAARDDDDDMDDDDLYEDDDDLDDDDLDDLDDLDDDYDDDEDDDFDPDVDEDEDLS